MASVGSRGNSYDNALAESTIGQLKTELVHRRGPWRTVQQLEFALFEYLDWWNHRRLQGEIGMITPVEKEAAYARSRPLVEAGTQRTESLRNPGRFSRPVPACWCSSVGSPEVWPAPLCSSSGATPGPPVWRGER